MRYAALMAVGAMLAPVAMAAGADGRGAVAAGAKQTAQAVKAKAAKANAAKMQAAKAQPQEARPAEQAGRPALPEIGPPRKLSWRLKAEDYPRTDGSTSAHPLGVLVACRLTGTRCQWAAVGGFGGLGGATCRLLPVVRAYEPKEGERSLHGLPYLHRLREDKVLHKGLTERSWHAGTHGSWVNLIGGTSDLIFVCRKPSADETKLAAEKKVAFDARPIALDAFVFLRNVKNPVEHLSVQQIRDIYAGRIAHWKELGGPDGPIHAYQRDRNSGSQVTMERLVMRGLAMPGGPRMIGRGMMGPYNRMRGDPRGLGFTFWYYNAYMQPDPKIRTLAVGGVAPTPETIRSRRYVYTTEVYAVTRADEPDDSTASRIQDWLGTPEGQAVVAESGYTPIQRTTENTNP